MLQPTLDLLAIFPDQLAKTFASVPERFRDWRPESWHGIPSERLTPIEQLCHVRDIEIEGYHVRIRRTLSEHQPVLDDIDGETLARERGYASERAEEVLDAVRSVRQKTINMLRAIPEPQLSRGAIFEGKPTTLRGLVHFLASHDQQHLSGLQWLLAKLAVGV